MDKDTKIIKTELAEYKKTENNKGGQKDESFS